MRQFSTERILLRSEDFPTGPLTRTLTVNVLRSGREGSNVNNRRNRARFELCCCIIMIARSGHWSTTDSLEEAWISYYEDESLDCHPYLSGWESVYALKSF